MQRYEVEAIFEQKKDGLFEDINISSQKPIAIILGGQPACGKSTLINGKHSASCVFLSKL